MNSGLLTFFCFLSFFAGWAANDWRVQAQQDKQGLQAVQQELTMVQHQVKTAERIDHAVVTKKRENAARADRRAVAGNGLRIKLEALQALPYPAADECRAERASADHLANLLNESRILLEEGSRIVDDSVTVIDGLQQRDLNQK